MRKAMNGTKSEITGVVCAATLLTLTLASTPAFGGASYEIIGGGKIVPQPSRVDFKPAGKPNKKTGEQKWKYVETKEPFGPDLETYIKVDPSGIQHVNGPKVQFTKNTKITSNNLKKKKVAKDHKAKKNFKPAAHVTKSEKIKSQKKVTQEAKTSAIKAPTRLTREEKARLMHIVTRRLNARTLKR